MPVVYVLTNQAMPELIKIGFTDGPIEDRMRQLDTTGMPLPFECFYAVEVDNAKDVEKALHEAFGDRRIRDRREFFRLTPDKPSAILRLFEKRNVTPVTDVIEEPGDATALAEARQRRPVFRFSMVGIKPGEELTSVFDETIKSVVRDDRWITFRGAEDSLSSSAGKIAKEKGYNWAAIQGAQYWMFNGKSLTELRKLKEDAGTET
jgi:T5orf172 domain